MGKKLILIADDEEDMADILSMRFEINGYGVIVAKDGEEAIKKTEEARPDLMILDLMLPKISGFEVCKMLRSKKEYENFPIIVLSALDQQEDREKAIRNGADAYFIKPFDLELLLNKIKTFIG